MLTCALANSGSKTKAASKSGIASSHLNHIKKNKKETKNNASCGIFSPVVFKNVNTRVSNLFSIFKDMLHELQRVKFPSINLCLLSS